MFPLRDQNPVSSTPVITGALIFINIAVFVVQLCMSDEQLAQFFHVYGLVPKRIIHPDWAATMGYPAAYIRPFFTSQFIHGGWLHLIGNMWFLWIFGNNVEDRMGSIRFLLFYLFCGAGAALAHVAVNPQSTYPMIGASGAIAGILAAYLRLFPRARVLCLVPVFFIPLFIPVPAVVFIVLWAVYQVLGGAVGLFDVQAGGGIAWWTHIGGFLLGFFTYQRYLKRQYRRSRS